jgi:hypothetical protein
LLENLVLENLVDDCARARPHDDLAAARAGEARMRRYRRYGRVRVRSDAAIS